MNYYTHLIIAKGNKQLNMESNLALFFYAKCRYTLNLFNNNIHNKACCRKFKKEKGSREIKSHR